MTNKIARILNSDYLFPSVFPYSMINDFERLFKELDFYDPKDSSLFINRGFPRGDIYTHDGKVVIELALAGYKKEGISVRVEEDNLIVSSEKCSDKDRPRSSLARTSFKKSFHLSKDLNKEEISASFEDGILKVIIPKKEPEKSENRVIDIK